MTTATLVKNIALFTLTVTFIYLTYLNPDFFLQFSSFVIGFVVLLVSYFVAKQVFISQKYNQVARTNTTKQSNVSHANASNFSEMTKKYTQDSLQKLLNSEQFKEFKVRKEQKINSMSEQQQRWELQNQQFLKDWSQNEKKIFEQ